MRWKAAAFGGAALLRAARLLNRKHRLTLNLPMRNLPRCTGDDRSNRNASREVYARQTGMDKTRRHGCAGDRARTARSARVRYRDAAVRQWRTAAGAVSAEAADDRSDQPPAAARDAVLDLQ